MTDSKKPRPFKVLGALDPVAEPMMEWTSDGNAPIVAFGSEWVRTPADLRRLAAWCERAASWMEKETKR